MIEARGVLGAGSRISKGKGGICAVGAEQEQGEAARNIRPTVMRTWLFQLWGIKGRLGDA